MTPLSLRLAIAILFLLVNVARSNPVITEIMADNVSVIADEDGDYSDWIEIHNPDSTPVDLTDWSLTDDQMAIPGGHASAGRIPDRVGFGQKQARSRIAVAHEILSLERWGISGIGPAGRNNHRAAVRAEVSGDAPE